jgi:hypothetical protein
MLIELCRYALNNDTVLHRSALLHLTRWSHQRRRYSSLMKTVDERFVLDDRINCSACSLKMDAQSIDSCQECFHLICIDVFHTLRMIMFDHICLNMDEQRRNETTFSYGEHMTSRNYDSKFDYTAS